MERGQPTHFHLYNGMSVTDFKITWAQVICMAVFSFSPTQPHSVCFPRPYYFSSHPWFAFLCLTISIPTCVHCPHTLHFHLSCLLCFTTIVWNRIFPLTMHKWYIVNHNGMLSSSNPLNQRLRVVFVASCYHAQYLTQHLFVYFLIDSHSYFKVNYEWVTEGWVQNIKVYKNKCQLTSSCNDGSSRRENIAMWQV